MNKIEQWMNTVHSLIDRRGIIKYPKKPKLDAIASRVFECPHCLTQLVAFTNGINSEMSWCPKCQKDVYDLDGSYLTYAV